MQRKCLDCNEPIAGRSDKKFCSDQCRNNYNNRMNCETSSYMRNVNQVLRKNNKILAGLNPDGKIKIHKDKLTHKGFNFNFFTNIYKTQTGNIYYFCYEHGYLPLENDFYALVTRKEEKIQ